MDESGKMNTGGEKVDVAEMTAALRKIIAKDEIGFTESEMNGSEHDYKFWKQEVQNLPQARQEQYKPLFDQAKQVLHDELDDQVEHWRKEKPSTNPISEDEKQEMVEAFEKVIRRDDILLGEATHQLKFWRKEIEAFPREEQTKYLELFVKAKDALHEELNKEMGE